MTERFANVADRLGKITFRSNSWETVTATVISSTYRYAPLRELNAEEPLDNSFYLVRFNYTVNGEIFIDEYRRSDPLEAGHQIVIRYNPLNPAQNNLSGDEIRSSFRLVIRISAAVITALLIYLAVHFDVDLNER
jgi:hypothetical protein